MVPFDAVANDFERFRALPSGVPQAVRRSVWGLLGLGAEGSVLDLGAGTGRIGFAFVEAGDRYVGVDPSSRMLNQFAAKIRDLGLPTPNLVQADGRSLPFPTGSFDAVLIVQVLSGVAAWRLVLEEARRVLRTQGALILGRLAGPPDGLDSRLREALATLMSRSGIDGGRRGAGFDEVMDMLAAEARGHARVIASRWEANRTPRDFLARHQTGARFATLSAPARQELLDHLADWAIATFGSLDSNSVEPFSFEINVFRF